MTRLISGLDSPYIREVDFHADIILSRPMLFSQKGLEWTLMFRYHTSKFSHM